MTNPGPVGFVGLGKMGWPMAANLVASGFPMIVYDASADVQARFVAEHVCSPASSPAAFADAQAVVTMLPDDRVVQEAVLSWGGGIASALSTGTVIVDMSSSNPRGTRELGRRLSERGIALVDAPVSGGVPRAIDGTLTIMVGGDDQEAVARVEPVLKALGNRLFPTGPLGSAHAAKALNNYLGATAYAALSEALAIGDCYGLSPATIVEIVNTSTGRSFTSEHVFAEHVLTERYGTGFALGLLAKDVGIADDLAHAADVAAPVCDAVAELWSTALSERGFAADHSEAHLAWFAPPGHAQQQTSGSLSA
jgi:3-hydroxyisobutyrate dehydrogenase